MGFRWVAAWLGGAVIGVVNGVLREGTYGRRSSENVAHQISVATAIAAFAGYFALLQRAWPITSGQQARRIGAVWVGLTVVFEFGFGRLVAKKSWSELLADYNLAKGRTWVLVLLWLAAGPDVIRRIGPPAPDRRGCGRG